MNLLKALLDSLSPTTRLPGDSGGALAPARSADRQDIKLAVSKAVRQLSFIARSYDFPLCEGTVEDLQADLEVMLAFGDLSGIRLELINSKSQVLFEFRLSFTDGVRANGKIIDPGKGIELPILDRREVSDKRLIIHRNGREALYRHLLKLSWGSAPTLAKAAGSEYRSDHAAAITGGRQAAAFHVTNSARRRFTIVQTGTKRFGFARDMESGRDGIFFFADQLPSGVPFEVGAQFTAVLVQTPRGLQVRSCAAS